MFSSNFVSHRTESKIVKLKIFNLEPEKKWYIDYAVIYLSFGYLRFTSGHRISTKIHLRRSQKIKNIRKAYSHQIDPKNVIGSDLCCSGPLGNLWYSFPTFVKNYSFHNLTIFHPLSARKPPPFRESSNIRSSKRLFSSHKTLRRIKA